LGIKYVQKPGKYLPLEIDENEEDEDEDKKVNLFFLIFLLSPRKKLMD
jgi:hypothetical protein